MSLIGCAACGKQLSEQAHSCPNCGHPIAVPPSGRIAESPGGTAKSRRSGMRRWLLILLLLGGGAVLVQTGIGEYVFDQARQIIDSQRILGKWVLEDDLSPTLEFFSDGTLRAELMLITRDGSYKLLPNRRMEVNIEGILWGHNEATGRYDIIGDELLLTSDTAAGISRRFRRAK